MSANERTAHGVIVFTIGFGFSFAAVALVWIMMIPSLQDSLDEVGRSPAPDAAEIEDGVDESPALGAEDIQVELAEIVDEESEGSLSLAPPSESMKMFDDVGASEEFDKIFGYLPAIPSGISRVAYLRWQDETGKLIGEHPYDALCCAVEINASRSQRLRSFTFECLAYSDGEGSFVGVLGSSHVGSALSRNAKRRQLLRSLGLSEEELAFEDADLVERALDQWGDAEQSARRESWKLIESAPPLSDVLACVVARNVKHQAEIWVIKKGENALIQGIVEDMKSRRGRLLKSIRDIL